MSNYAIDAPVSTARAQIRIMLVDDHLIMMQGLEELLKYQDDLVVVGMIVGGAAAAAAVDQVQPDVILMDIQMPDIDGIAATQQIRQHHPQARILIFSSSCTAQDVSRAFAVGACGYWLKNTGIRQVIAAIHQVMAGEPAIDPVVQQIMMQQFQQTPVQLSARDNDLTARETAVLQLIARGRSNKEIGIHLGLAENTVKHHVSSILQKLDLADRTQLAIYAHQHQLV